MFFAGSFPPANRWLCMSRRSRPGFRRTRRIALSAEIICMREGTLEFQHDGVTERASAGDILFVAKGTMHGVRNVGDGPAAYFVIAIGGDTNRKQSTGI